MADLGNLPFDVMLLVTKLLPLPDLAALLLQSKQLHAAALKTAAEHPDFKLAQFCSAVARLSAGLAAGPREAPLPYPAWERRRQLVNQIRSERVACAIFRTTRTTVNSQPAKWPRIFLADTFDGMEVEVELGMHPRVGEYESWCVWYIGHPTFKPRRLVFARPRLCTGGVEVMDAGGDAWLVAVNALRLEDGLEIAAIDPVIQEQVVALFKTLVGLYRPLRAVPIRQASLIQPVGHAIDIPVAQLMP